MKGFKKFNLIELVKLVLYLKVFEPFLIRNHYNRGLR